MTHSNHNSMRRSTLRKLTGLGMGTILTAGAGAAAVIAPFNSFAKSESKAAYRFRFGLFILRQRQGIRLPVFTTSWSASSENRMARLQFS